MEDPVPYKTYTFWPNNSKPEVRRFTIPRNDVVKINSLTAKLLEVYPGLRGSQYDVTWKDPDGDDVTMSSDSELLTFLQSMTDDMVKLYIYVKSEANKEEYFPTFNTSSAAAAGNNVPHCGVVCDGCEAPVVGFRYKCVTCRNYDLCSRCECNGLHPEHCMVRIAIPTIPRDTIKEAIKRTRYFLKDVLEQCPYAQEQKRHRSERSSERKHHRDRHHGDHHGRRQRGSWLETFANYMNEFANLAGDVELHPQETQPQTNQATTASNESKTPEAKTTEAKTTEAQTTSEANQANETQTPNPSTSQEQPQVPHIGFNVFDIEKLITYFADMHGLEIRPKSTSGNNGGNGNNENDGIDGHNDVDVEQGDEKAVDPDTVSVRSEASSVGVVSKRDESPDKVDDWTVINKEKDLEMTYLKEKSPETLSKQVGFNLPAEFQERASIAEGQNLYPPLNTATAVLNPKEPSPAPQQAASAPPDPTQAPKPAQGPFTWTPNSNVAYSWTQATHTPSQPQPRRAQPQPTQPQPQPTQPQPQPTQPQPQPPKSQAQPRQPQPTRHAKPHIEAAINHMLAMGFTNDGEWLTQLLESKDGNIAAVLDLLTPVSPKK